VRDERSRRSRNEWNERN